MNMEEKQLFFLPLPGVGHLIPAVELAKRLLSNPKHPFSITVFLMHFPHSSPNSILTSYIQSTVSTNPSISFLHLPPLPFLPNHHSSSISILINMYKPHVKQAISSSSSSASSSSSSSSSAVSTRVAALIVDLFATTMIDVAADLGIPAYVYFASGAALLGLMLYLPTLDGEIPCEFEEFEGEVEVPGMAPLPPMVMPAPLMEKEEESYRWFLYHGRRFREAEGLIVNTFADLEPGPLKAIRDGRCLPDHHPTPSVYPVGPLLALHERLPREKAAQLMEWLDQQPNSSVVFLCFGSMGAFSAPQVTEMAVGLERSGHRFLWALRCHPSTDVHDAVEVLPDGFLDRTTGRGLVWRSWAPQVAILAHDAVGGFVSHCGWNSCLESAWFGKPILAWPLQAEQRLNAFQMVRDYGMAVDLRIDYKKGDGLVRAEELERGLRCLMGDSEEGKRVRKRAREVGECSKKAVERGGSSRYSLELLADQLSKGEWTGS